MTVAMWVQAVRNVQMVLLLHLIKHQGLEVKTASLVPKVKIGLSFINNRTFVKQVQRLVSRILFYFSLYHFLLSPVTSLSFLIV